MAIFISAPNSLAEMLSRQPVATALRNFTARACPKAQPVMQATAWVAQRSISTKVIKQTLAVVIARVSDAELL
jgi:hypothetical protein